MGVNEVGKKRTVILVNVANLTLRKCKIKIKKIHIPYKATVCDIQSCRLHWDVPAKPQSLQPAPQWEAGPDYLHISIYI